MTFLDVFVFDLDDEKRLVGVFNFILIGFENWVIYMATRKTLQISEEIQLSVYIIVPASIIFNIFWTIMIAPRASKNCEKYVAVIKCKGLHYLYDDDTDDDDTDDEDYELAEYRRHRREVASNAKNESDNPLYKPPTCMVDELQKRESDDFYPSIQKP